MLRPSGLQLDGVVLDDRVREQLPAHGLDALARLFRVLLVEREFDDLALADLVYALESERRQGDFDSLALWEPEAAEFAELSRTFAG